MCKLLHTTSCYFTYLDRCDQIFKNVVYTMYFKWLCFPCHKKRKKKKKIKILIDGFHWITLCYNEFQIFIIFVFELWLICFKFI